MSSPSPPLGPVLITGGSGFLGFHIADRLLKDDPKCQVHVMDIHTKYNRLHSAIYHTGDISSVDDVERIFQQAQPRIIFHTACPDSMIIRPALFERVNVHGTNNLLAAAARLGSVRAFINISSSSVIHDNVSNLLDADETLPVLQPPQQKRIYTLSKAAAESAVLAANRAAGDQSMLTTSFRPALIFGERDVHFLAKVIAVARQGRIRFQMGSGTNVFDYVYVGNLVEACILAAKALLNAYGSPAPQPGAPRVDGECFNVTNDERWRFWDFSRRVAALAGYPVRKEDVVVIPLVLGLIMAWVSEWLVWIRTRGTAQSNMTVEGIRFSAMNRTLNGEKAKRVLGYRPSVSMEKGLEKGVQWFMENSSGTH
ncbi:hypothetical protein MMC17_003670 [Xylographa soralifera]|nr:hypothetical protein [Xylographa soralifera]